MNKRLATLAKRFANAKAGVDASNRELREASARKLARLLALPDPAAPLAGLKDPALTPYDRDRLEANDRRPSATSSVQGAPLVHRHYAYQSSPRSLPLAGRRDVQRQAIVRMIESGPIPAIHGVVRWRLIDLSQWIYEDPRSAMRFWKMQLL